MLNWILAASLTVAPIADQAPPAVLPAPPPSPDLVLAIPPELQARLATGLTARSQQRRLERLVEFMFAPEPKGLGMTYDTDATHTVEEAYRTRRANCLGFTLMVVALARAARLEAYGQEIDHAFSWQQENGILFQYTHINAGVRIEMQRFTVDVASDSVIAAKPPKRIPDRRLLSNYYSNRAVELMAHDQPVLAATYIGIALAQDPDNVSAWNNAGVVSMRSGDAAGAERGYARALRLDREHGGALANMYSLYQQSGDKVRAERYRKRIERARLHDPFHYFTRALAHEQRGEYRAAIRQYRHAIKLLDSEHRLYFGLARAYLHLGDARRAGAALRRAHELGDGPARDRYQAKLEILRRQYGH
jgi:tetratricopeptide (TPR) repeat protein